MTWLAVLAGGVVGSALRVLLAVALPDQAGAPSVATLLVNLTGSFVLGLLVAAVWPTAPAWLRAGLGTGVIGSYTTFSALVVSLVTLGADGFGGVAVLELIGSVVLGLAAAAAGLAIGGRLAGRRAARIEADK